jgi:hypothetical protein
MGSRTTFSDLVKKHGLWPQQILLVIWYYTVTLTICRIGHKPKLSQHTKGNAVSAELRCLRCKKTLDFQVSIFLQMEKPRSRI